MKNYSRILIAVGIFLVGAALIPFVGLPQDGFNWQRYADAYVPMSMEINHNTGRPGSFFTVRGYNFSQDDSVSSPADTISIMANGTLLGTVNTDSNGDLIFLIETPDADTGYYIISTNIVDGPEISFRLSPDAPLWVKEDDVDTIFPLPPGIAYQLVHLPIINK